MSDGKLSLWDRLFLRVVNAAGYIGEAILILFFLLVLFTHELN